MATAALPVSAGGGVTALRAAESRATNTTGNGDWQYTPDGDKEPNNNNKKGSFSKKITAAIIGAMLLAGATFLGSSNSLLMGAMENLFTEKTDSQYTSASLRLRKIINKIFVGDQLEVIQNSKGWKFDKTSLSFKNRLKKNGITFEGSGTNRVALFNGEAIPAADWEAKLKTDPKLRDAYNASTRGRVATFFDKVADYVLEKKLNISRNVYSDYHTTNDAKADADSYAKITNDNAKPPTDVKSNTAQKREEQVFDENGKPMVDEKGNPVTKPVTEVEDTSTKVDKITNKAEADVAVKGYLDQIGGKVAKVGQGICAAVKVASMVSISIAVMEKMQTVRYALSVFESISKTMSGDGDGAPTNTIFNMLSANVSRMVTDFSTTTYNEETITATDGTQENILNFTAGEKTITQAPLEDPGIQNILADAPIADKESYSSDYSFERIIANMFSAFTTTAAAAATCATVDVVASVVSIIADVATFGAKSVISGLLEIITGTVITLTISSFLSFLIPTLQTIFFTDITDYFTGAFLPRGLSAANGALGQSGSGMSLAAEPIANKFGKATQEVIIADAEAERTRLSPFDLSSKNTFLGSIAYSFLSVLTTSGTASFASFLRTTAKSISSIVSPVQASGEGSSFLTTYGNCPMLESIGAVGDVYCNPIVTTDLDPDIFDIDLNDPTYNSIIGSEFNDKGEIRNGDLANYINFCANRDSPFGVADQSILAQLQATGKLDPTSSAVINSIPLIGDLVGIIEGIQDGANMDWATGKKCVNSQDNSSFWKNQGRYYQRYIEDSRLLQELGVIDENPVTAYEEQYRKEHPLDTSLSGTLARLSGLSKEDAETVIAIAEYSQFLDNYDPSLRIAMNQPLLTKKSGAEVSAEIKSSRLFFEDESPVETGENVIIAKHYIIYNDLRNRSYAV